MLRTIVRANEKTDVQATVADLRARCERAGLAPHDTAMVVRQVSEWLSSLVKRGCELAFLGSQITVTREFSADGYQIKLVFCVGDRRPWLQQVVDAVRGR